MIGFHTCIFNGILAKAIHNNQNLLDVGIKVRDANKPYALHIKMRVSEEY